MWRLAQDLVPIYRTLVSPGFEQSLELINEYLPLTVKKYPSGQKVFDWTIPDSWTVKEAYIEDMKGNRLIDFKDEPLFVGPYSRPVSAIVERKELLEHLYSLPHLPKAIPLCPSYYTKDWKLGVPHSFKEGLQDDYYRVHINSDFKPSSLCIGEVYLPGASQREIIFSTYLCHPFMANDNISGVVVSVELFKILSAMKKRFYSYRLIIIPETIGSVTFLYHHQKEMKNVLGGYAITCCGDRNEITFKKSWAGDSFVDRAGVQALRERRGNPRIIDFRLSGSDERQFNAPGFRIPMPTVMRSLPSEFVEYHSSLDNLHCIAPENLADTLQFILDTLYILDNNKIYVNKYKTEPFLTGYGIFKQVRVGDFGVFNKKSSGLDPGYLNQIIIHETDGKQDLVSIAEKYKCFFDEVKSCSEVFEKAGLIERVDRG
ncbi:MAG: DUF4910 domain-containing protein [Candidatus Omnitrophica bacterium]|nr:DUF4910 domain-containing protein [Candidatus Omnitrophota bacterium]